jgi:hypothetical protein
LKRRGVLKIVFHDQYFLKIAWNRHREIPYEHSQGCGNYNRSSQ